jgi:hypothetical protein
MEEMSQNYILAFASDIFLWAAAGAGREVEIEASRQSFYPSRITQRKARWHWNGGSPRAGTRRSACAPFRPTCDGAPEVR